MQGKAKQKYATRNKPLLKDYLIGTDWDSNRAALQQAGKTILDKLAKDTLQGIKPADVTALKTAWDAYQAVEGEQAGEQTDCQMSSVSTVHGAHLGFRRPGHGGCREKRSVTFKVSLLMTFCNLLPIARTTAQDCWYGPGCWVSVGFRGWFCVPETCWCGPTVFPASGASGSFGVNGTIASIQAPAWISVFTGGFPTQGSIQVFSNSGLARAGQIVFQGWDSSGNFRTCSQSVQQQAALPPPPPTLVNPAVLPGGAFQFTVVGVTNAVCVVEASADILNWVPIATNNNANSPWTYSDVEGSGHKQRFYRVLKR